MKILITGHSGFVGRHLQNALKASSLSTAEGGRVDLCEKSLLEKSIQEVRPDAVIHLAAQSNVPEAFKNPLKTFEINFQGTYNLLNALKKTNFCGRFLYVSSGEVYGLVSPEMLPVKESQLLMPRNPYAVSKVAAEGLCYQWSQTEKFEVIIVRPFNHIGPGQSDHFSIPNFAKQIMEIKKTNTAPIIEVGDIDVTRDFTDVRDVAFAYELLLKKGKNGEIYNVCSGSERSVRHVLEELLDCANIQVEIKEDRNRVRAVEQRRIYGCREKLFRQTGWVPQIPLKTTLNDILIDWEKRETCVNEH